jgi:predicted lysophospholipase L1 biosynthesis ABC-type transport system permease subunit
MQRSMILVSLVTANGVLIAANRTSMRASWRLPATRNPTAWWVTLSALLAVLLAIYWPWLAGTLRLAALTPEALAVALGCGVMGWPFIVVLRACRLRMAPPL